MRLWICSVVSLLIACGVFIFATYVNGDANWEPIHLPLPAGGVEAVSSFQISTSGSFHLSVDTPRTAAAEDHVACHLRVVITDNSDHKTAMHIDHLRAAATMQGIQEWESPPFRVSRGDYHITLSNEGATLFPDRGAMVTLQRDEPHPTETYLRNWLMRGVGWLALAVGVLTALIAAATMRTDAVPRARQDGDQSQ